MRQYDEVSLPVIHLAEPQLEFGHKQKTPHPKDGLFLYGPQERTRKSRQIRTGVIGTSAGIEHFRKWADRLRKRIEVPPPGKAEKKDRLHLANFPGIEEAFAITLDPKDFVVYAVDLKAIERATTILNQHEMVSAVAQLFVEKARHHRQHEEREVDIWILVIPEIVFEHCRPASKRSGITRSKGLFGKRQRVRSDLPLLRPIIDQASESIFDDAPDFHRHIKASFLEMTPTQILRETTLAPEEFKNKADKPVRRTQDPATVAWNIATSLYYKSQPNPPWRLADVRPGVCYIGLVYKSIPNDPQDHACCAAQMFLSEGDGVVFRGANGPWKTGDHEYHLRADAAKALIHTVLETYRGKHGAAPRELFIHGQTFFNEEEWRAFEAAAPKTTNVVGVRIRTTGGETKLFRDGDYPVLRGTAVLLDAKNAYVWTTGYVPQLDTYIGPETPNPLFITALRSRYEMPSLATILSDIMGLTKINYNSCNFNDALPVTVRFAGMVGEVLTMGSARGAQRQPFKFYI